MGNTDLKGEHQHWPDDEAHTYTRHPHGYGAPGYDENNGRHRYTYHPSSPTGPAVGYLQAPAPVYQPGPPEYHPSAGHHGQPQWGGPGGAYWPHQVSPNQPYTVLTPAYYGQAGPSPYMQPAMQNPHHQMYMSGHLYDGYVPAQPAMPAAPSPNVWMGRTKSQVDEDNMKIAKSEGAYDKRNVAPVGLKDDQMVWVVELDGQPTLRTFAAVKELKGSWKPDPRFESAWFFLREEDKK